MSSADGGLTTASVDLEDMKRDLKLSGCRYSLLFVGSVEVITSMQAIAHQSVDLASLCIKLLSHDPTASSLDLTQGEELMKQHVDQTTARRANQRAQVTVSSVQVSVHDIRFWRIPMRDISVVCRGSEDTSQFICVIGKVPETRGGVPVRKAFIFKADGGDDLVNRVYSALKMALSICETDAPSSTPSFFEETEPVLKPIVGRFKPTVFNSGDNPIDGLNRQHYEYLLKGLEHSPWFHGVLSREEAEKLLISDGDFLVRQSAEPRRINQVILCGKRGGEAKHVCLIEKGGVMKDGGGSECPRGLTIVSYVRKHEGREFKGRFEMASPVGRGN